MRFFILFVSAAVISMNAHSQITDQVKQENRQILAHWESFSYLDAGILYKNIYENLLNTPVAGINVRARLTPNAIAGDLIEWSLFNPDVSALQTVEIADKDDQVTKVSGQLSFNIVDGSISVLIFPGQHGKDIKARIRADGSMGLEN